MEILHINIDERELIDNKKRSVGKGLCKAFKELHKLTSNDNPFPVMPRDDRSNSFVGGIK